MLNGRLIRQFISGLPDPLKVAITARGMMVTDFDQLVREAEVMADTLGIHALHVSDRSRRHNAAQVRMIAASASDLPGESLPTPSPNPNAHYKFSDQNRRYCNTRRFDNRPGQMRGPLKNDPTLPT